MFLGSSAEAEDVAARVGSGLAGVADVTYWQRAFVLGKGTLDTLIDATTRFDFAILVLTADDVVRSRARQQRSPRDNLVFEAGLFMGALGRGRTFIAHDKDVDLKLPSDLAGITLAKFDRGSRMLSRSIAQVVKAIRPEILSRGLLRPAPHPFWHPWTSDRASFVLGAFFGPLAGFEPGGLLGVGDAVCLTEVATFLRSRWKAELPVQHAEQMDGNRLSENLIVIGGADNNPIAKAVLERPDCPIAPGNSAEHEVSFRSRVTGREYVPGRETSGECTYDYGAILRAPNPFNPDRKVLLLFGCFGFGTWAAGRHACSARFLADPRIAAGADGLTIVRTEIVKGVPQFAQPCE